jgi:hypothetical protein
MAGEIVTFVRNVHGAMVRGGIPLAAAALWTIAVTAGCGTVGDHVSASSSTDAAVTTASAAPSAPTTRDDALRAQLAASAHVRTALLGRTAPVGQVLCGINVVGENANGTRLYVWILCEDITVGPDAAVASGGAEPAVVDVTGSGGRTAVAHVTFPRQQSLRGDIARLFPPGVADTMRAGQVPVTPGQDDLLALARSAG